MLKIQIQKPVDMIKFVLEHFTGEDYRQEDFYKHEILGVALISLNYTCKYNY